MKLGSSGGFAASTSSSKSLLRSTLEVSEDPPTKKGEYKMFLTSRERAIGGVVQEEIAEEGENIPSTYRQSSQDRKSGLWNPLQ